MRNAKLAASALGMLLVIVSDGLTQKATAAPDEKTPLQIVDECIRALQQRDFATYVDHLSGEELKLQAGYALVLTWSTMPAIDTGVEKIEPELLLLLRAIGDLVQEHTTGAPGLTDQSAGGQAIRQLLLTAANHSYAVPNPAATVPHVRDVFMKSAAAPKDPRSFLIALFTELSRPIEVAGAKPANRSNILDFAELAEVYRREEWTLYTRGDYAIAVPKKIDPAKPDPAKAEQAPWPLRIEFKKIDGAWKISHVLPMSVLVPVAGATSGICVGPSCNVNTPTYSATPAAAQNPSLR